MKEKEIQSSILEYLGRKNHFFWRNNSGASKTAHGGFIRFGAVGSPDIFVLKSGKLYGLEVKTPKGRMSPGQVEFAQGFIRCGGCYAIVHSIDDVQQLGL